MDLCNWMDLRNWVGLMSLLIWNPMLLRRRLSIVFRTKLGTAHRLALMNPSPPLFTFSWDMSVKSVGMSESSGMFSSCSFCLIG